MNKKLPIFLILLLSLANPMASYALPEDREKPIDVKSSSNDYYQDEGIIIYIGSVVATQGSLKIEGDRAEGVIENGALVYLKITGNPARYQQQPQADKDIIYGSGNTLTYDQNKNLVIMEENAQLIAEGNTLTGYHIEYDVELRLTSATAKNEQDLVNLEVTRENDTIYGSAYSVIHDDITGLVTMDKNVELIQGEITSTSCHMEYNLNTWAAHASGCGDNDRVNTVIQQESAE